MVRKRKSAMKNNKKNEVAKPLVEEDQPGIDEKKDCEPSERSQSSVAEKIKGSRKPYKAKKASAVDAFDVAEASSQVLPIGDSNAGQGKLKPFYPPSGRSVMVVESLIKAKVIQNCLGDMYEAFPSYGHVWDLAGRSRSVRPDDDFSMVWEVPATASTHLKSIKLAQQLYESIKLSDKDTTGLITYMRTDGLNVGVRLARAILEIIAQLVLEC